MNTGDMNTWIQSTLNNSRNGMHLFHMLHCMRDNDDETYAHSLNVAMICNTIGTWLDYSEEEKTQLTLAGLLHDVGKVFLPIDLLKKKEGLTSDELEQLHNHTVIGYNSLKRQPVDKRIRYAALMHHERCDGSGYPNHFSADQIDDFAKIVAIADSYDAMTSPRIYRKALCPFEVVHLFQSEGLCLYDPKYLTVFLEGIIDSFLHSRVRLSNGMEGEIVLINKSDLSKPMVKCGEDFVNLFKEEGVSITEILT
jgi:HD-GYP domain-containing protein (c-di-GMP phosphodiesterase class II)